MKPTATPLAGLFLLELDAFHDARGRFERLFCDIDWNALRPNMHFSQVNLSLTRRRGCVRGLHYQRAPHAEAKMIRCVRGRVFDVAVDLRPDSGTFLAWHGYELDADEPRAAFIPEGFAHGFQALTDEAQLLYFHTASYSPSHEAGLRHDDPGLAIAWPLPVTDLSERDSSFPLLGAGRHGVPA